VSVSAIEETGKPETGDFPAHLRTPRRRSSETLHVGDSIAEDYEARAPPASRPSSSTGKTATPTSRTGSDRCKELSRF
jgi:hypothetical protein